MKTSKWMTEKFDLIKDKTLRELVIPGTHNSGSFFGPPAVRNQNRDFFNQLRDGIRYFDIEVGINKTGTEGLKNNEYYFTHGSVTTKGLTLDNLKKVGNFANLAPKEFIILNFNAFMGKAVIDQTQWATDNRMTPDDKAALKVKVLEFLGQSRVFEPNKPPPRNAPPAPPWSWPTLQELKDDGKNIILLGFDDDIQHEKAWNDVPTGTFEEIMLANVQVKQVAIKNNVKSKFNKEDTVHPEGLVEIGLDVWTLTINTAAESTNEIARMGWIPEWYQDFPHNLNLFSIDFYNLPDMKLVEYLIHLNGPDLVSSGWTNTEAMTTMGGNLYIVQGGKLLEKNPPGKAKNKATGWGGTETMTTMGGNLYIVQGGKLWEKNPSRDAKNIANGWGGTEAMTSMGGNLYIVHGGKLWQKNPSRDAKNIASGWGGTEAMTSMGGNLYIVQGGKLWEKNPSRNAIDKASGWSGTKAMTSLNGKLYIIKGNTLWEKDLNQNARKLPGKWANTAGMVSLNNKLYIVNDNRLWEVIV